MNGETKGADVGGVGVANGFTPGPWEVRRGCEIWASVNLGRDADGGVLQPIYDVPLKPSLQVGNDGKVYAYLCYDNYRQFPSGNFVTMQEANAQLIAAAPDLLAACVEFVRKVESGEARSTRSYAQMKAAIAKARGHSPLSTTPESAGNL